MATKGRYHIGERVREVRHPFRRGTVIAIHGSGAYQVITVRWDGGHPANCPNGTVS